MGFDKRRASEGVDENFAELKAQFLIDIKAVVQFEEIPFDLILNWDQTAELEIAVGHRTISVHIA